MKKLFLRTLSVLFVFLFMVNCVPSVFAIGADNTLDASGEITRYSDASVANYTASEQEAARIITQGMMHRENEITVRYTYTVDQRPTDEDVCKIADTLFDAALAETEAGNEGDYLRYSYTSCSYGASGSYQPSTGVSELTITYHLTYYTTRAQEEELTAEIQKVIQSFGFTTSTTDREKIDAIYGYLTNRIVYDYANLEDDTYKLKYTAYAALMHKTAVCEGYAVLLYRMLKDCGVDTRVITGSGNSDRDANHAWNVVALNGQYYYCDATWDAETTLYQYYLKGTADFPGHTNDDKFNTDEFRSAYPPATDGVDVTGTEKQEGDFKYILSGGRAVITEYVGTAADVVVPATIDNAIVFIGSEAFYEEPYLETLTFSEGVGKSGVWPINRCMALKAVHYPSTMVVTDHGRSAYTTAPVECPNLETITVAAGNPFIRLDESGVLYTYDMKTLLKCPAKVTLEQYTVPTGVENIGNESFEHCASIRKIVLPTTVKNIYWWAFSNATSLEEMAIPEGVEFIGQFVFVNTVIKTIHIPKTVTEIRPDAFESFNPTSITVDEENPVYYTADGALCDRETLHKYAGSAAEYIVPNGIVTIGNSAFYGNKTLKKIALPASLQTIGQRAFGNNDALEHVTIPDGVKTIGAFAFSDCDMLASICIPASVTSIDVNALYTSPYRYTTVYGETGSAAQTFAQQAQLPFKELSAFQCSDGHALVKTTLAEDQMITRYCYQCNICGVRTTEYAIIRTPIDAAVVTLEKNSYEYTGKAITPKVKTVTLDGKVLIPDVDYKIAWATSNQQIGTATLFIDGIGNYCNQIFANFEIVAAPISKATVTLAKTSYTYTGSDIVPAVTVTFGGQKLSLYDDYTVTYKNNRNAGTATVTVVGNSRFTGSVSKTFTIKKASQSTPSKPTLSSKTTTTVTLKAVSGYEYSKDGKTWQGSNKFTGLKPYTTYKFYQRKKATSNKNSSALSVAYTVKTNCSHRYTTTTTKATLTKNGKAVTKCTVCANVSKTTTLYYAKTVKLSTTTYTYDGKVKKPSVTVKDAAGKTISSSNYTVTYASGRKNVGTYKVTVKMKGNYSGSKTLTFKIIPAKTTVSKLTAGKKSITVTITKRSTQITGYQVQYSTSKSFSKATTKTVSSYKTTKYTIKSLSAKKTYYVRVRTYKTVGGVKYYSGWSTYKYVKTK